jgi:hypothetical protein
LCHHERQGRGELRRHTIGLGIECSYLVPASSAAVRESMFKENLQKEKNQMEVHVFVSLAHVVNRHIEYPTIIIVQGETRERFGSVQYLAHVSLAIQNEVEKKTSLH